MATFQVIIGNLIIYPLHHLSVLHSPFQNNPQKPAQSSSHPDAVMPPGGVEQLTGPHVLAAPSGPRWRNHNRCQDGGKPMWGRGSGKLGWGLFARQGTGSPWPAVPAQRVSGGWLQLTRAIGPDICRWILGDPPSQRPVFHGPTPSIPGPPPGPAIQFQRRLCMPMARGRSFVRVCFCLVL